MVHNKLGLGCYPRGRSAWSPALGSVFCEIFIFRPAQILLRDAFTMVSEAAAISDSINSHSLYAQCSEVDSEASGQVFADLKTYFEKALDRRRVVKDTS